MIKKYATKKSVKELTDYMDTLVRYMFNKLDKEYDRYDTIYYPASYLYRENISEFDDFNHLDIGYKNLTIRVRKITNSSTMIMVKLENVTKDDWRYDLLMSLYRKAVATIDRSLDKYI